MQFWVSFATHLIHLMARLRHDIVLSCPGASFKLLLPAEGHSTPGDWNMGHQDDAFLGDPRRIPPLFSWGGLRTKNDECFSSESE